MSAAPKKLWVKSTLAPRIEENRVRRRRIGWALAISSALTGSAATMAQAQSAFPGLTAEFLRDAADEIEEVGAAGVGEDFGDPSEAIETGEEASFRATAVRRPGASAYVGQMAIGVEAEAAPLERGTSKLEPDESEEEALGVEGTAGVPGLSFSSNSFRPEPGIDERLQAAIDMSGASAAGERFTYAFVLTSEYPSPEMVDEFAALDVEILGPHDDAVKVRLPLDRQVVQQLIQLPYVEWIGYSRPEQKIDRTLGGAMTSFAGEVEEFPLIVSLFEDDFDGRFAARMREIGVVVGRYDADLQAYRVVASQAEIDALTALDFVLFIEVERPTGPGHNESMAMMGVDYIRPGGGGTRFGGNSTIVGIMDTGFMLGSAAAVPHVDLDKFGCGRNFTSDTADVWNDQHGHGTHVLGTIVGTGTGDARLRGVATGVGESATTRVRAAKVFTSAGGGSTAWFESAVDYMSQATDCANDRPLVINFSGAAHGIGQTGTDSMSRKLDAAVWNNRQAYIVAAANSGPGAQTIGSPAVAKNAIAVGSVLDHGHLTIGDVNDFSSRGPSGDGRMKPNVVGPGAWITSASAGTTNGYHSLQGTSMATPHVAGVAATLMEHYPGFRNRPHLLRAHLMATSHLHDNITSPRNNSSGGRNDYGLGRVSDYVAHWPRNNANGWNTKWAWRTVNDRNWAHYDLRVPAGTDRLVVVMSWDEPAASAGAARAVLYDLDLWADFRADCVPDSRGQCGERASQSRVDNTEYLIIDNPAAGIYRLKIVNWRAPSFGLPAAIAAVIVRGDPTPAMTLSATPSPADPPVGSTFTVTTRVASPSYVTSGAIWR